MNPAKASIHIVAVRSEHINTAVTGVSATEFNQYMTLGKTAFKLPPPMDLTHVLRQVVDPSRDALHNNFDIFIGRLLCLDLTQYDHMSESRHVSPALARMWTALADHVTYTIVCVRSK